MNSDRSVVESSTSISAVHGEIIQTHILARLDGPTLASAGCASSQLHHLSADDRLWQQLCNQTWPSTTSPAVRRVISTMPSGHRSFYYDSFGGFKYRPLRIVSADTATPIPATVTTATPDSEICSEISEAGSKISRPRRPIPVTSRIATPIPRHRYRDRFVSVFRDLKPSFPTLNHRNGTTGISQTTHRLVQQTSGIISAVDVSYRNKLILSKVHETETESGWFLCSPFRVDLLDPKETVSSPAKFHGRGEETLQSELENNLTLSWILIDPSTKRAANLSSSRPVSVSLHWLTGDVQARYATVLGSFLCTVLVTCGGKEGGDVLQLKEVSLHVEDMEGRTLSGKESLVILQEAMESGKKVGGKRGDERERYEEFLRRKREMRERKQRRERQLDLVCIATTVTIFVAWVVLLLRRYS